MSGERAMRYMRAAKHDSLDVSAIFPKVPTQSLPMSLPALTEGQRLPAPCGGDADQVVSRHDDRPHLALDGRGLSELPGGKKHVGRQTCVLKPAGGETHSQWRGEAKYYQFCCVRKEPRK